MSVGEIITAIVGGLVLLINTVGGIWIAIMIQRHKLDSDKRAAVIVQEVNRAEVATAAKIDKAKVETVSASKAAAGVAREAKDIAMQAVLAAQSEAKRG